MKAEFLTISIVLLGVVLYLYFVLVKLAIPLLGMSADYMEPVLQWTEDWEIGIDIPKESKISRQVLDLFVRFWKDEGIEEKSKSTMNRYRAALISLGSYIVEQSITEEGMDKTAKELLLMSVGNEGGPLLFQDEETWQNELDIVGRKLHKYYDRKNC